MKATVFGVVSQLGAPVEIRSTVGHMTGAYAVDDLELELLGDEIDFDHDGEPVGEIVYAEITPENQLAVVGVLDDGEIAATDRPVYWSGT